MRGNADRGVGASSTKYNSVSDYQLMKIALLSILAPFVGRGQRDNNLPADRSYCSCGALMPLERRKSEASMKTERPLQGVTTAGK